MKILRFTNFIKEAKKKTSEELKIDEILDKISLNGIESLTDLERRFLDGDTGANEVGVDLYSTQDDNIYIDEYGDYVDNLSKDEFILKVLDMDNFESYSNNNYTEIEVYEKTGKYLIDVHFSDMAFPELKKLNLEDLGEGVMEYSGKLNTQQLIDKLKEMGFNAVKKINN